ncbi:MAG: efflux RND transporter periplasmic adaptor subunit [Marinifilaceae bacterium]|jgi:membrane fusion protein (multidrug efflux system)|nr:efflux RND transporter periplasmic adaptor subunit [Marinifilaceae bacterium]
MRIINLIGFVFITLGIISCGGNNNTQSAKKVIKSYKSQKVKLQDIEISSSYPANLKGKEEVEIKPRVSGFIEKLYVDEGAMVSKGQKLFKINSPDSRKALDDAKAKLNTAQIDVERMKSLADKDIISQVQLKSYQNKLESAKAVYRQASESMTWVVVSSPVDGVVGQIDYRIGNLVDNKTILTKIASTKEMFANFSLNEKELYDFLDKWNGESMKGKISNMPDVQFMLSNGKLYNQNGRIKTIAGVVDKSTGSINLRASFPNTNKLLVSGASGKIILPEMFKNTIVIPQKASFKIQDKTLVYIVENNKAVQKVVEVIGTNDGKKFIVKSGLEEGDIIVIDDIVNLTNGQEIKAILN